LFKLAEELAANATLEDIVNRGQIATQKGQSEVIADAVLGAVEELELYVRDTLELYFDKLALNDSRRKSVAEAANGVSQSNAQLRLNPSYGSKTMTPNNANRDLGNIQKLFRERWAYEGTWRDNSETLEFLITLRGRLY